MVAHFCHKEVRKLKNIKDEAKVYKKKEGQYFTFPENVSQPVSLHDFGKIEKATETSIWLYQVVKIGKSHDIRLLCKGNNPSVDPERIIHLCLIEDSDHIVLVKEIQKFIGCARPAKYSIKRS